MQNVWKIRLTIILGVAVAGMVLMTSQQEANARPKYIKVFAKTYPKLAKQAKAEKCLVCHPKKSKKVLNTYGKSIKPNLPKKNSKDEAKIKKAIEGAEGEDSDVAGKTFGDLIKDGKLPNATS